MFRVFFLRYSEPKDKLISYSEETIGLPLAGYVKDARGRINEEYLCVEMKISSSKEQEVLQLFEDKYENIEVKEERILFEYAELPASFHNFFKVKDLTANKTYNFLKFGKSNNARDVWIQLVIDNDNTLWLYIVG